MFAQLWTGWLAPDLRYVLMQTVWFLAVGLMYFACHADHERLRGHGYFRFVPDGNGVDFALLGEWGHDQNETGGGPWNASRDRRRQPHVGGTTTGGSSSSSGGAADEGLEDLGPAGSSGSSGSRSTGSSSGSSSGSSGSDLGLDGL